MLLPRKADDLSVDWGGSPCPYLPATDGNDCPLHLAILVARAVNWRNQAIALMTRERPFRVLAEATAIRSPHLAV